LCPHDAHKPVSINSAPGLISSQIREKVVPEIDPAAEGEEWVCVTTKGISPRLLCDICPSISFKNSMISILSHVGDENGWNYAKDWDASNV
jgi:hypothetical protein